MSVRAPIEPPQVGPPSGPPERRAGNGVTGPALVAVGAAVVVVGLAVALVLWTGRDAGESDPSVTPETSGQAVAPAAPEAADPRAAREAEVIAAYRAAWDAQLAVGRDPRATAQDERIRATRTGDSLVVIQRALGRFKAQNRVYVGEVKLSPVVVDMGPDTATIRDCVDDATGGADAATGAVVEPAVRVVSSATVKMTLVDGVWKQSSYRDEKVPCTPAAP